MNLLSFNIRGLGRGLEHAAFKILLDSVCPVMVFIQETMSSGLDSCSFFLRLRPGWLVSDLDSYGNYSRMLVAWNPLMADLQAYNSSATILLVGSIMGFKESVHLLNIYGPYDNRRYFWEPTSNSRLLNLPNLILGWT